MYIFQWWFTAAHQTLVSLLLFKPIRIINPASPKHYLRSLGRRARRLKVCLQYASKGDHYCVFDHYYCPRQKDRERERSCGLNFIFSLLLHFFSSSVPARVNHHTRVRVNVWLFVLGLFLFALDGLMSQSRGDEVCGSVP